jgi:transcriptional regulator with XRE-family HTH domain
MRHMSTSNATVVPPAAGRRLPFDGPRVRWYRQRAGLTAPQLLARIRAQPFELSLSGLTMIERGTRHPRPDTARAIALALGLSVDHFDPACTPEVTR